MGFRSWELEVRGWELQMFEVRFAAPTTKNRQPATERWTSKTNHRQSVIASQNTIRFRLSAKKQSSSRRRNPFGMSR